MPKSNVNALVHTTPVPLECLQMASQELTGATGTNRAPSFITQQIAAQNDLQAIQIWLLEFEGSPQTQRTYRKEAERLLLWSLLSTCIITLN